MAGFFLYSSNRQELLVKRLAGIFRDTPLANPLAPEIIMVQNHGMQRWVSLELARRNGIEANTRYIFPNELLHLAFREVISGYQPAEISEKETLAWTIMAILPGLLDTVDFALLRHYLEDGRLIKRYQLATRIAGLFDQYAMFRSDMLLAWEKETKGGWQAHLWRALPRTLRDRQKPRLRQKFFADADRILAGSHSLPERISIFGISSLPPLHVDVLCGLSPYIEINLFFQNPTDQYWGDLLSDREILHRLDEYHRLPGLRRQHFSSMGSAELHLEQGNPLLASLGRYVREFFQLMIERDLVDGPGEAGFDCPLGTTLLHRLQRDIFQLENSSGQQGEKTILDAEDHSLQIHSCHSPMREVEVLHDQLSQILENNPELSPGDIVVMTPDIEIYAPLIQSVFAAGGKGRFPFSIADRSMRQDSKVIRYFLEMLKLGGSRFTLNDVFDFLESEPLRDFFQLTVDETAMVRELLEKANVRWGLDPFFRRRKGTPATYETTWEFGIDRILTGYALPLGEKMSAWDILPFDDIEGGKAAVFGRFLKFFERLQALVQPGPFFLETCRTLPEWADLFQELLAQFFHEDESWGQEQAVLRQVFDDLQKNDDYDLEVDVEVMGRYLQQRLEDLTRRMGFLGFGVTFCSMMPMRAIPFQVIALLGMNDKSFPRPVKPLSFDLMQEEHRLGDRSLKDEDCYLFLEMILSSRQILYISYVGQSIKDNSSRPPSALVAELLNYLEHGYRAEGIAMRDFLVTKHHLQPFNPAYFQQDSGLFSYSRGNMAAARALQESAEHRVLPLAVHLPPPEPELYEVSVDRLVGFFNDPARFLLNQRLKVFWPEQEAASVEEEIFSLSGLDRYIIQSRLMDTVLQNKSPQDQERIFRAQGILPLSGVGEVVFKNVLAELETFSAQIKDLLARERLAPLAYDFALRDFHFSGEIRNAYEGLLLRCRPAPVNVKDRLRIFLEQLVCSLQPQGYPLAGLLVGFDNKTGQTEIYYCRQIDTPVTELQRFLHYYRQGLSEPLPFFPRTAGKYMDVLAEGDVGKARQQAGAAWSGTGDFAGEMERSPYLQRCFQNTDIFADSNFEKIAVDLLTPIYAAQERIERKDLYGIWPL